MHGQTSSFKKIKNKKKGHFASVACGKTPKVRVGYCTPNASVYPSDAGVCTFTRTRAHTQTFKKKKKLYLQNIGLLT